LEHWRGECGDQRSCKYGQWFFEGATRFQGERDGWESQKDPLTLTAYSRYQVVILLHCRFVCVVHKLCSSLGDLKRITMYVPFYIVLCSKYSLLWLICYVPFSYWLIISVLLSTNKQRRRRSSSSSSKLHLAKGTMILVIKPILFFCVLMFVTIVQFDLMQF